MKKRSIFCGPILLLLFYPAILPAESIPVYIVKPFLIDRAGAVQKIIGPYYSEQIVETEGRRVYRYTSAEGNRLIVDDNGTVQVIINAEIRDVSAAALTDRIKEMMDLIGAGAILQKTIRWEYREEGGRCSYRGIKILDGLAVQNGDRIELNMNKGINGYAEIALYFQWYIENKIIDENSLGMRKITMNSTSNTATGTKRIYFHQNGRYYIREKDAGAGR